MHTISGNHLRGFLLASVTAVLWGILPITLKEVLAEMDPYTITFFRFASSALVLAVWLLTTKQLPRIRQFSVGSTGLLLLASVFLTLNYGFYIVGLNFLEPKTAQVLIQLAPFLLLIGSVLWFKEPFSTAQRRGAVILFCGLLLFFNQRLLELFTALTQYTQGVLLIVIAAIAWAIYAMAQKQLLKNLTSVQVMLLIYLFGAAAFLPLSDLGRVFEITPWAVLMLIFCCLNTLIGYGAFAEAMNHWHASKVSAVLATTPLVTIVSLDLCSWLAPEYFAEVELGVVSTIGALMVVGGSVFTALNKR